MDVAELQVFLTVAAERSFSRAAERLHRTQPAVSQAVRRLEDGIGERLFDRSSKGGRLTEAGELLLGYAQRLVQLKAEAEGAVRELVDDFVIAESEGAVHVLLPIVERFRAEHPEARVEVRRSSARQIPSEVLGRGLDFGVLTFPARERGLRSLSLGDDELAMLIHPGHPLARRSSVTMEEVGRQTVIAHNEASPARERVLRLYEQRHTAINIQIALPSLDGIKRAVEMGLGVALLPKRCALAEIARGQLAAVRVSQLRLPRQVRLVYRRSGEMSQAAAAFVDAARAVAREG